MDFWEPCQRSLLLLGVAGGEFLIPTFVLLFGADIKLATSLSLAVSLPTMLVGGGRTLTALLRARRAGKDRSLHHPDDER
jgi:hypothetical protein